MKKLLLLVSYFCLILFSCNKEDSCICCLEDPIAEIDWLQEIKMNLEKQANPSGGQIIQYTYQDICAYWIDTCHNCSDNLIRVYDKDMNLICEFGGIAGLNTCPDFEKNASKRKILFETVG